MEPTRRSADHSVHDVKFEFDIGGSFVTLGLHEVFRN